MLFCAVKLASWNSSFNLANYFLVTCIFFPSTLHSFSLLALALLAISESFSTSVSFCFLHRGLATLQQQLNKNITRTCSTPQKKNFHSFPQHAADLTNQCACSSMFFLFWDSLPVHLKSWEVPRIPSFLLPFFTSHALELSTFVLTPLSSVLPTFTLLLQQLPSLFSPSEKFHLCLSIPPFERENAPHVPWKHERSILCQLICLLIPFQNNFPQMSWPSSLCPYDAL